MARKATARGEEPAPPAKPGRRGTGRGEDAVAKDAAGAVPVPRRALRKPEVEEVFRRFRAAEPEPQGELEHHDPFTLLVAVVLSAQATDAGVNKATRPLFATVDTPAKMVALGEERLREAIKTIGLFRTKAKNVIALCQKLLSDYRGEVPRDREALQGLPGVGRKTANVVLNIAFGEPTIAVDTHVFRVSNRTGLAPGRDVVAVEAGLEKQVPRDYLLHAHHWLILHGRYVCKAQRPLCESCLINDLCQWPGKKVFLEGKKPQQRKAPARSP